MNELKPGPWHWEYHPRTHKPIALVSPEGDIFVATGNDEESWASVAPGHLAILETAPEMLAALEDLMLSFGHDSWESVHDAARVDYARSIIAKAKGGGV